MDLAEIETSVRLLLDQFLLCSVMPVHKYFYLLKNEPSERTIQWYFIALDPSQWPSGPPNSPSS